MSDTRQIETMADLHEETERQLKAAQEHIAELEGARAKAREGSPHGWQALEWNLRQRPGNTPIVNELDRRADIIAAQADELAKLRKDLATSQQIAKDMIEAADHAGKACAVEGSAATLGELERLRKFVEKVRATTTEIKNQHGAVVACRADGVDIVNALAELDRAVPAQAEPQDCGERKPVEPPNPKDDVYCGECRYIGRALWGRGLSECTLYPGNILNNERTDGERRCKECLGGAK